MPLLTSSRLCLALAAAGLLLAHAAPAGSTVRTRLSAAATASADAGPGRVIVTYRSTRASALSARVMTQSDGPVREAQTLSQRHALDLRDGRTVAPRTQVVFSDTLSSEQLRQKLAADPDVASVSIDRRRYPHAAPNDPLYADLQANPATPTAGQWYLRAPTSTVVSSINAEAAWTTTTGSSSIVVAVLDTGVRPEHPDLAGKLLPGMDFIHTAAVGNDGDGLDGDASDPGDWITQADTSSANFSSCDVTNSSWHGTQTASLIGAATNNGVGMASVGRHVMLLPVRVLGKCGGFDSDIIAGMRWAAGLAVSGVPNNPNPARVLNLSLGSTGACESGGTTYTDTIATLNGMGVLVVASAGNDDLAVNSPANCPGAIAVAGLRHAGTKSGFSSLGSSVALSAPAGNCQTLSGICQYPIITATNSGTQGPAGSTYSAGLGEVSLGTSFSAPLVAGSAALMLAANPSLTAAQVQSMLKSTTRPFPSTGGSTDTPQCQAPGSTAQEECYCTTTTCGAGMLDTRAAVQAAAAGRPVAHLGGTPPVVTPGAGVTLDGSASTAGSGATLKGYLWEVIDGAGLATITSANNASSVTLSTVASTVSGRFTVRLTVTDTNDATASATETFTLGTPPAIVTAVPQPAPADSGGGGGAFDPAWAVLLLAAAGIGWRARRTGP